MYALRKKETKKESDRAIFKKEINYLEISIKILTLISSLAIFLGGIIAFIYLKSIQHPNIFTETISNPHGFIAIVIAFGILLLSIFIGFITPHAIFLGKSEIPTKTWKEFLTNGATINEIFFTLIIPHLLYIYLLIAFLTIPDILYKAKIEIYFKYILWAITTSPFLPLVIYFFKDSSQPISKKISNYFPLFFILFSSSSLSLLFPLYIALHTAQWTSNESNQFLILIGHEFLILLNLLFASSYLSSKNNHKNKKFMIFIPTTLSYLFFAISSIFIENLPFRLLHLIRFVESSNDASWYLLHRNNSNISDEDLKKIKLHFIPKPLKKKDDREIEIFTREAKWRRNALERDNALFGYMAWNLGNMKVFCPVTAENNINVSQIKNMSSKCLTIDGKALQKMHESYISSHSMTP